MVVAAGGEHGGDPASVKFFSDIGLDYVSCSPFRVPLARLAAAQAAIQAEARDAATSRPWLGTRSPNYFDSSRQVEAKPLSKYLDELHQVGRAHPTRNA